MLETHAGPSLGTLPTSVRSILFVTYHFPPEIGGIHTRISHYIRDLRSRGIAVTVFVISTHGTKISRYKTEGADIVVCPGQIEFLGRNALYLIRTAFSKQVDVIHVFTGASTIVGSFTLFLGRMMRIPSVISFFGKEQFEIGSLVQRILLPFALNLATSIGVNTPYTSGFIPRTLLAKTHVLFGGAEVSGPVLPVKRRRAEGPTILFVGRLIERKGGDDLIRALGLIRHRIPKCKLVFIGDGPYRRKLEEMVRALGLDKEVEFRGTLTGQELHDAYAASSVVALPSKYVQGDSSSETLGLTLIEGSMHAKPLIGTLHGGIPEIVKDGVNGFLVPENNPEKLAEALFAILSDETLRKKLGKKAQEMAKNRFTWNAATNRLLESYAR